MDVHLDKKPNGIANSNGASHDDAHVAPKISEDHIEVKDYDVKECTEENSVVDNCCEKQDVVVVQSKNFDTDEVDNQNENPGSQKSSSPTSKASGPAIVRKSKTVLQPCDLATEKLASGTTLHVGSENAADVNNGQTPITKKSSQVMETFIDIYWWMSCPFIYSSNEEINEHNEKETIVNLCLGLVNVGNNQLLVRD